MKGTITIVGFKESPLAGFEQIKFFYLTFLCIYFHKILCTQIKPFLIHLKNWFHTSLLNKFVEKLTALDSKMLN